MRPVHKIGNRYTRLIIVGFVGKDKWGGKIWECRCDCGKLKIATSSQLSCRTKSCGCLLRETTKIKGLKNRKYEIGWETEKRTFWNIYNRCNAKSGKNWRLYSSRNIKLCERWDPKKTKNALQNFLDDMGKRPKGKTSIDRIDNSKGYSPDNCRWADFYEQNNNRRKFNRKAA